ncbi:MAG TPA: universal stress protein [Flavobacteriaceae bacterium]|nr:universal stress protein [Flavobacteriaceae bacterium]
MEIGTNIFSQYEDVDLIAMCTHGRTGFLSLFTKSIAEGVTNRSELPVMTIKL